MRFERQRPRYARMHLASTGQLFIVPLIKQWFASLTEN
jgi:hypothetical protein